MRSKPSPIPQSSIPTFSDLKNYLTKDLRCATVVDEEGALLAVPSRTRQGPIVLFVRRAAIGDRCILHVECRDAAIIQSRKVMSDVRSVMEDINALLPLGSWFIDDDGEVHFWIRSLVDHESWRDQLRLMLAIAAHETSRLRSAVQQDGSERREPVRTGIGGDDRASLN